MRTLFFLCFLLTLPLLALLGAWLGADAQTWATWSHMAQTVLPAYALTSVLITLGVGVGVAFIGSMTAAAVTLFDFPGRRMLEWMLLLPLAMPAYVLAYAYTDTLQYSGPLQMTLRAWTGASGPLWPDVRSTWGAVLLFIMCLYPYVYLLVRSALQERGVHLMEAARLLGAGLPRRIFSVALPMARPAIAAGTALALMETLADYGVGNYFGLSTFTTGIYRAWLSMNDRTAAAQLATLLLVVVAILLIAEQSAQRRLRFATARPGAGHAHEAQAIVLHGKARWIAWITCALPILLGFVLPVIALLRLLLCQGPQGGDGGDTALWPWARFGHWAFNSFSLATLAAVLTTALALALAFMQRMHPHHNGPLRGITRLVSLGYAVPGAVIAVGILLSASAVQVLWPNARLSTLLTSTLLGLMYAYMVRFSAVALQAVEAGYARVPVSFDESARMLGQTSAHIGRIIHWPLMRRATWTALLLVFVDVMKELPATLVLRPFDSDTLAVVANQLARDERLAEAALPSLAIVLVGLVPVIVLSRATRH